MVNELPIKSKAKAGRTRHFHYLVLRHADTVYMRKRGPKDIWEGLYDFALTEKTVAELPAIELLNTVEALGGQLVTDNAEEPVHAMRHVLSHQKVEAKFHPVWLREPLSEAALQTSGLAAFTLDQTERLPKPIIIANYLNKNWK
ncbi:NUDIX domain-containing protein [Hymenobacter volaticus]|uniref:NUDIX domain-containing protein n=1 Tax=Hymenobacter volaticus TaxID=2932254 RepID=UPI002880B0E3|nr:NUDIX domain-containing protein [Hymenobacter volaticus]